MVEEKVHKLAKGLTENIKNGTIRTKTYSTRFEKYNEAVEELCLFRYKRYLGSLRCMLDTQNMRQVYLDKKDNISIKKLVKKDNNSNK